MHYPLCVSCKHCSSNKTKIEAEDGWAREAICGVPVRYSLVDGGPILWRCADQRGPVGTCGVKGTLFERDERKELLTLNLGEYRI